MSWTGCNFLPKEKRIKIKLNRNDKLNRSHNIKVSANMYTYNSNDYTYIYKYRRSVLIQAIEIETKRSGNAAAEIMIIMDVKSFS